MIQNIFYYNENIKDYLTKTHPYLILLYYIFPSNTICFKYL